MKVGIDSHFKYTCRGLPVVQSGKFGSYTHHKYMYSRVTEIVFVLQDWINFNVTYMRTSIAV